MWKLKIAEGGTWLKTPCDFLGRQVWEFDSKLGSCKEREAVERAREEFQKNRFQKKQASDPKETGIRSADANAGSGVYA